MTGVQTCALPIYKRVDGEKARNAIIRVGLEEALPYMQTVLTREFADDGLSFSGGQLQRLISNTNFGDYESRNWFDRMLRESGLFDRLEAMGIRDGDLVSMYDLEFEYQR